MLVYVLRELLRAPLEQVAAPAAMWAMTVGLAAGLTAELLVSTGRQMMRFGP
jgi:hypothetical protein